MSKTKAKRLSFKERYRLYWERNRKSEGYLFKKSASRVFVTVCRAILLFGMCFLILQPILTKVSLSFMARKDLYDPMVISIPKHFTGENYQLAAMFMEYWSTLRNTLIVSGTIAILQVGMATLVGYGFARFDFPLKKFWFVCVILVIVIPPQTISTALYMHFRFYDIFGLIKLITGGTINIQGSALPYYLMSAGCMGLKNGLYIFMIRQFFRTIPKELEEAAYVDGCGTLKTFLRIMLPDAKPILTSCFLFSFVWQWTDGFYTKLFLSQKITMLSLRVSNISNRLDGWMKATGDAGGADVGYINAIIATGTMLTIVPLIIIYLFAQKGFVESLSSSGIKM